MERGEGMGFEFFFSQSNLWASAGVPTGSVPATQSQKREVGTIALWGLSLKSEEGRKGGGLMVGWGGCECDGLVSHTLSLSMSAT